MDQFEHFHGVYLLLCENPNYKGRTYIGYTVDPVKRLKRHNAGEKFGGAKKTSNKGPWNMVLIIHGFSNSRAALRFEWAWQHPHMSRRLSHVPKKKSRESLLAFYINVVSEMLQVAPWHRLPLVFRWFDHKLAKDYSLKINLPAHMPLKYGNVIIKKIDHERAKNSKNKKDNESENINEIDKYSNIFCDICCENLNNEEKVMCINENCKLNAHLICLAKKVHTDKKILPINGICPCCNIEMLWGDIVRKKTLGKNMVKM